MAEAVAAEVGFEGLEREALRPFEPTALKDVSELRTSRKHCCRVPMRQMISSLFVGNTHARCEFVEFLSLPPIFRLLAMQSLGSNAARTTTHFAIQPPSISFSIPMKPLAGDLAYSLRKAETSTSQA